MCIRDREWDGRFGRVRLDSEQRDDDDPFGLEFEVESYLEAHARRFVRKYDPNCYLYLSRSMDWFDPVSYTHLDVYKRQLLPLLGAQRGIAPVSYTHLDVYKRQLHQRSAGADIAGYEPTVGVSGNARRIARTLPQRWNPTDRVETLSLIHIFTKNHQQLQSVKIFN